MKVNHISKWTFYGIALLILILPISRHWRLFAEGKRTREKYRHPLPINLSPGKTVRKVNGIPAGKNAEEERHSARY